MLTDKCRHCISELVQNIERLVALWDGAQICPEADQVWNSVARILECRGEVVCPSEVDSSVGRACCFQELVSHLRNRVLPLGTIAKRALRVIDGASERGDFNGSDVVKLREYLCRIEDSVEFLEGQFRLIDKLGMKYLQLT